MSIKKFIENANLKRGFVRMMVIASIATFGSGAYYDFSPTAWLYGSVDYSDVIGRASFDLKDENCKNRKLEYVFPVDKPNNVIFLVCDEKKDGFCAPIKNCEGLVSYAEIVGKEKIGRGLMVGNLSASTIESDVTKVKNDRLIEMLKDRFINGIENLYSLWIFVISILIVAYVANWIYKGFRRD